MCVFHRQATGKCAMAQPQRLIAEILPGCPDLGEESELLTNDYLREISNRFSHAIVEIYFERPTASCL